MRFSDWSSYSILGFAYIHKLELAIIDRPEESVEGGGEV